MLSISVAAVAIEVPNTDLGTKFVELVKSGNVLDGLNRNTLFHDPDACIIAGGRA
jgi:hypothetical protein